MAVRPAALLKVCLVIGGLLLSWHTVNVYKGIFGKWKLTSDWPGSTTMDDVSHEQIHLKNVITTTYAIVTSTAAPFTNNVCEMQQKCKSDKISFRIVSGAASVIGPSICVNDEWLMSNSLGNVGRGMNVVTIDGKTGKLFRSKVFDVYAKENSGLESLLENLNETEIILIGTFDDASFKLSNDAKTMLKRLGSKYVTQLGFRDNWVFVGGKNLMNVSGLENHIPNLKVKNKFGNWPSIAEVQGCLPKHQ